MNYDAIIQLENQFYIAANSSYADTQVMVLNHIDTFAICDRWGDIRQLGTQAPGIYHEGTRFISALEFRINKERPLLLSSAIKEENEIMSVDLTNDIVTSFGEEQDQGIQKGTIHIARNKFVRNGSCHERIEFFNYGNQEAQFISSLYFEADFRDIFEIRGIKREKRGEIFEVLHSTGQRISIKYKGLDNIIRETEVVLVHPPDSWENQFTAVYNISIPPHSGFSLEYSILFKIGDGNHQEIGFAAAHNQLESERHKMRKRIPSIFTANEQFNHWVNRSRADILSLLSRTKYGYYPYAGVPWYNTPFGRDGIITALQILWIAPGMAHDTLIFLAKTQAKEVNAFSDAEPGKIFHEFRGGEMVELGEIPFKEYYGSVDATPLFIVLAGAYYQRTGDLRTIKKIWSNIEAALNWIKEYGNIDENGFLYYHHKSIKGLVNQGWKDSHDSMSHANGELAPLPIALCEVQGYVYDAKLKAAFLADALKKTEFADTLRHEAMELKKRFNEQFWDEELKTYSMALDGNKQPLRVKSSNAGHTLFSGIADVSKTADLVNTLMGEELFSGWGIRTLGSKEKRYNPMSYHNGSVWPHDVSLIASGFSRYGFRKETQQLTAGLFDASLFIELQRLPELFCGFKRRGGEGPTAYPVACSPQAWSVAAVFKMLEACLHIEIDGVNKKVIFRKPLLPEFIDNISLTNLKLGDEEASFELHRYKSDTGINIVKQPADWEINWIK